MNTCKNCFVKYDRNSASGLFSFFNAEDFCSCVCSDAYYKASEEKRERRESEDRRYQEQENRRRREREEFQDSSRNYNYSEHLTPKELEDYHRESEKHADRQIQLKQLSKIGYYGLATTYIAFFACLLSGSWAGAVLFFFFVQPICYLWCALCDHFTL
jgi:Flp pilus assembly protein TadB